MLKLPYRNKFYFKKNLNFNTKYNKNIQPSFKPNGFWYYCLNDGYNLKNDYEYIHQINIIPNSITDILNKDKYKLLSLKNTKDFDIFTATYGKENKNYKKYGDFKNITNPSFYHSLIDWNLVREDFGGIEVPPTVNVSNNYLWFDNWNFSGGCIWTTKTIINNTKLIYEQVNGTLKEV